MIPEDLRYTEDHEWVRLEGAMVRVGITDHAQKELGDAVFVELPEVGRRVRRGEPLATVESVKAVGEVFAPVSGEVTAVNKALDRSPQLVNEDPYGEGWIVVLGVTDPREADNLLDARAYAHLVGAER